MNKESLARQFFMRHMPNMLTGNYWEELEKYYQVERDKADGKGAYDSVKYRSLAQDFFKGKTDNVREMVSYVFGTGKNKFWCFEHNITDVPMVNFNTVMDIVVELQNIQKELMDENEYTTEEYVPVYDAFNLWCCMSEPFENIIINSPKFIIGMELGDNGFDFLEELTETQDDSPNEITIADDGEYINTRYWDDDIHRKVYRRMIRERHSTDEYFINKIVEAISEHYPNTVFIYTHDDIVNYTFACAEDAGTITLEDFKHDMYNKLTVIDDDIMNTTIDGVSVMEVFKDEWEKSYRELYARLYNEIENEINSGALEFPEKEKAIYFL